MPKLTAPSLPPGPRQTLSTELHTLHRRAGWPSVRDLSRALGVGVASPSRIHDAFTKPRLPDWGLLQVLVIELAGKIPRTDPTAEAERFHALWDAASAVGSAHIDGPPPRTARDTAPPPPPMVLPPPAVPPLFERMSREVKAPHEAGAGEDEDEGRTGPPLPRPMIRRKQRMAVEFLRRMKGLEALIAEVEHSVRFTQVHAVSPPDRRAVFERLAELERLSEQAREVSRSYFSAIGGADARKMDYVLNIRLPELEFAVHELQAAI
ncbi:hypothetical protein [Streptomyces sp. NPDC101115]|uniref:hypothetical protein n=1 Tax=Streptomyces sp. NPDC101115 TaxID=3366106 RepID=UPI00382D54A8